MRRLILILPLLFLGCQRDKRPKGPEPDYIEVDHILIGVRTTDFPVAKRNQEEARKLAYELFEKLKDGADWAKAKRDHSDDPPPGGPYAMSNKGVQPRTQREFPREKMVPAFGDVGFGLDIGEIGMADYDPKTSKYGYHIIKRVG